MIHLRKRHPALRRRRFFQGEVARRERARAAAVSSEAFPASGPVRPTEAGLPPEPDGRPLLRRLPRFGHEPTADIIWHGVQPRRPDFSPSSHTIAFALDGRLTGRELDPDYQPDQDFYVAANGSKEPVTFCIPPSPSRRPWRRVIDT